MLKMLRYNNKGVFSLVELIIVAVVIGIFCAMVIPSLNRARTNTYRDRCIIHLRKITAAKENWSLDAAAANTSVPTTADLDPYIDGGTSTLTCPLDTNSSFATSYNINAMSTDPICRIDEVHTIGKVVASPPPPPPPPRRGGGGC